MVPPFDVVMMKARDALMTEIDLTGAAPTTSWLVAKSSSVVCGLPGEYAHELSFQPVHGLRSTMVPIGTL